MGVKSVLPDKTPCLELVGEIFINPSGLNDYLYISTTNNKNISIPKNMKTLARIYRVTKEDSYQELALSLRVSYDQLFFDEEQILAPCVTDKTIMPAYKVGGSMVLLLKRKTGKSYTVVIATKKYFRCLANTVFPPYGLEVASQSLSSQRKFTEKGTLLAFPF
ncbi:MAG: hypothetical protein ACOYMB_04785 [Patescibacteria group bacterium]